MTRKSGTHREKTACVSHHSLWHLTAGIEIRIRQQIFRTVWRSARPQNSPFTKIPFVESKGDSAPKSNTAKPQNDPLDGFMDIPDEIDEELPFG